MTKHKVDIDADNNELGGDARKKILAATRTHFLNALSFKDFEIEHKVNLDKVMTDGGTIDYNLNSEDIKIKSASLKRKTDKDGAHCYFLKIVVE